MLDTVHPNRIRLEVSTVCQLKCPSCPTAAGKVAQGIGAGFLKFEDFKKLVDGNPQIKEIELSNWGEIFLNPDLSRIIRYAYERKIELHADNGVNCNDIQEEVVEDLVKYRFRSLTCSLDGASAGTYRIYRINGDFEKVIGNILKINAFKKKYSSRYPLLKWQFVAFGHNEHEILKAKRMARSLGMRFWLKLSWEDLYTPKIFSPVQNGEVVKKETGLGVANRSEYKKQYGENYAQKLICSLLWHQPQINFDGKILGCCVNHWGDFGDAFRDGLVEGVNGEKIRYTRQMLSGKVEEKTGIPCTTCVHYQSMKKTGHWITSTDLWTAKVLYKIRIYIQDDRFSCFFWIVFQLKKILGSATTRG